MNRAKRIYTIIKELERRKNSKLIDGWKGALGTDNTFDTYRMISRLHREVELLEADLSKSDIDKDYYKPLIKRVNLVLEFKNFDTTTATPLGSLPEIFRERLHGITHMFPKIETDIELDMKEDIDAMTQAIDELEDDQLKEILKNIIETLESCDKVTKISGIEGLEEIFKSLYCQANTHFDDIQKAPRNYLKSFISAYTKVKKGLTESTFLLNSPDKFNKIIELLSGG